MIAIITRVSFAAAVLASAMLIPQTAAAQSKTDICHATGNGSYRLISVAAKAAQAHLNHGDILPGAAIPVGEPRPGLYGGTVQQLQLIGPECSVTDALETTVSLAFSGGGWGGWSCVEPGYLKVLGGGVIPDTAVAAAQGAAKPGVTVGGYTYPVYPHYTYSFPEEGWVVQAGTPLPTGLYVLCGK